MPVTLVLIGFDVGYLGSIDSTGTVGLAGAILGIGGWLGLVLGTMGAYYELRDKLAREDTEHMPGPRRRLLYVLVMWAFFFILMVGVFAVTVYHL